MSVSDSSMMEDEIINVAQDLVTVARMLQRGHVTPDVAFLSTGRLVDEFTKSMSKILQQIHSQPIIPGMERSPVNTGERQ